MEQFHWLTSYKEYFRIIQDFWKYLLCYMIRKVVSHGWSWQLCDTERLRRFAAHNIALGAMDKRASLRRALAFSGSHNSDSGTSKLFACEFQAYKRNVLIYSYHIHFGLRPHVIQTQNIDIFPMTKSITVYFTSWSENPWITTPLKMVHSYRQGLLTGSVVNCNYHFQLFHTHRLLLFCSKQSNVKVIRFINRP